jgi:uncharacterized protein (DUF1697 family)
MTTYVSLLRGINVGAQKRLPMETLRGIYTGLGFTNVRTYVQSGNVVFDSLDQNWSELVRPIEAHIEYTCGFHVELFIRHSNEIQRILTHNPFLTVRKEDPGKLHVSFYYRAPSEIMLGKLTSPSGTPDEFALAEMAVYLFCQNGYGKTKLSNSFFERKLGIPVTTRNWNTVNALYSMAVKGK